MKSRTAFYALVLFFFPLACVRAEENITISTYYPSPQGVYDSFQLYPRSQPASANQGAIYYDDSLDKVRIWNGTGWNNLSQGGGSGLWTLENNSLSPANLSQRVGIGMADSVALNTGLEVSGSIVKRGAVTDGHACINLGSPYLGVTSQTAGQNVTISGGGGNHASCAFGAVISGGLTNTITNGDYSAISGGSGNAINGAYSSILGGDGNVASGTYNAIAGGQLNNINGTTSVIAGGRNNTIASAENSFIGGGENNGLLYGGLLSETFIGGGRNNTVQAHRSAVAGGENNTATESEVFVAGGKDNEATGDESWVGGRNALAGAKNQFVWADSQASQFDCSSPSDSFNVRASGGIWFHGAPGGTTLIGNVSDIAEFMNVPEGSGLEAGKLASVVQDNTVDVSNSVAQDNLVGVVTGKRTCTFHMGDTQSKEKGIRREAISLAGPVYGYVCNEGGALKAGDPITSSSKPGIGMKAARPCRIIGYAMQDEAFRDKDTAELMIFVKLGESVTPEYVAGLKANIAELKKRVARLKATPK